MIYKTLAYLSLIVMLFVFIAWQFTDIFIYVSIALVFTTILRPLTSFISKAYLFKIRIPRVIAIFISFAAVIGVVFLFVLLFIPLIIEQTEVISSLSFDLVYEKLSAPLVSFEIFLVENNIISSDSESFNAGIKSTIIDFITNINFKNILNNLLSFTGTIFISIMAVVFITFFLLYEKGLLRRKLISVIPNQYFEMFIAAIFKIEKLLSNYLIGLLLQMMAIFSIAALGLSLFGIKYAITIAVFAALANLIPYLGPLLGASFAIIVGVSTRGNFVLDQDTVIMIAKILSVFAGVQAVDNVLLQPLIFSKSVKAHPLEIFIVIFAAATIAGIPGMISAIPIYTILRVSAIEVSSGFRRYHIFQIQ